MSDRGGNTTRDVLLRVRVDNLSKAGFDQVSAAVKGLTSNIDAQVASASKAAISEAELTASIKKLKDAADGLTAIATLIDRFKNFDDVLAKAQATSDAARKKLDDYRASLEKSNDTSAKAEKTLTGLVAKYENAEKALRSQQSQLVDLSARLQKAGIDTNALSDAEARLRSVADETGAALNKLNDAKANYAQNARLAKEAAQAEREEREKGVAAAKAEAAALAAVNEKLAAEAAASQKSAEQYAANYSGMLASVQRFNAETRAAQRQRGNDTADATVAEVRAAQQAKLAANRAFYDAEIAQVQKFNQQTRELNRQRINDAANAAVEENRAAAFSFNSAQQAMRAKAVQPSPVQPSGQKPTTTADQAGIFGLRPYAVNNLAYQINDVVSGIASGQPIIQVFAQQIGQIGQLFPQFNAALIGALRLLPIIAPAIAGVAIAIGGLNRVLRENASNREFSAILTLNADGANYSAKSFTALRKEIRDLGVDWKDAGDVIKQGLAGGLVAGAIGDFAKAARDTSDVTGKKVPDAMQELVTAFTHGFDAVKRLNDQYNFLTGSQYRNIQALFDQGKGAQAQALAFDLYRTKIAAADKEAVSPFTEAMRRLSATWDNFLITIGKSEFISSLVDKLAGLIGIIDSAIEKIDKLIDKSRTIKSDLLDYALGPDDQASKDAKGATRAGRGIGTGSPSLEVQPQVVLDSEDLKQLVEVAREASKTLIEGQKAVITSGRADRASGTLNHPGGHAIDVKIVDQNGQTVTGFMGVDSTGRYTQFAAAMAQATNKLYPTRVSEFESGTQYGDQDSGHFGFRAGGARGSRGPIPGIQADNAQRLSRNQADVDKIIKDMRDADATANESAQRRLDFERKLKEFKDQGYLDEAANRGATAYADQQALVRQRERDAVARQIQIRNISAGSEELAIIQKGKDAREAAAKITQNEGELNRIQADAEAKARAELTQKKKEESELQAIDNQLAALARQNELKNVTDIEARVKGVANQYNAILANLAKFKKDFPNVDISGRITAVGEQKDQATQLATAQGYLDKLNSLQADRNALISTYNTLVEKGAVTLEEKETKIREAFERTSPAINQAAEEFSKFLLTADKIDKTKFDLFNAKLKEIQANAQYISPLMKSIKDAFENSFASGLSNAFETISASIGGVIAGTQKWKDVLSATRNAALTFFSDLLKAIGQAIIKYEALQIASSLGFGTSGGGGGILASLFGGGEAAAGSSIPASVAATGGLYHSGGVVGLPGAPTRPVAASWFAHAPRYHSGAIVGLAPDEQAAILRKHEEVLREDNPRHIMNINKSTGQGPINIRSILVQNEDAIPQAMANASGEKVIVATVMKNIATIRSAVRS